MTTEQQGVAQRVIQSYDSDPHWRAGNLTLQLQQKGAKRMHAELSAEARAIITELESQHDFAVAIRDPYAAETSSIQLETLRDAFHRLGLDLLEREKTSDH